MRRFAVITFGCQMNQHDSDRMVEVLLGAGFSRTEEPEEADLVLLNTCSVREKAEQKLRSEVGRLGVLKRRRPELVIGVAGCVAQQEGQRLMKSLPQIDLILGPDNIPELPRLLSELELGGLPMVRTQFDTEAPSFLTARPELLRAGTTAFVTVMKGCNERCTFCIVPHTRGPERYRPAAEILEEVRRLVASGVREVTLLGQTVNSYRDPARSLSPAPGYGEWPWEKTARMRAKDDETEFPALLRLLVAEVPELLRLRYTSPHPRHLTWSLIAAHRDLPQLARHVHLPVQSGSDAVLRRMSRRYEIAEYEERVARLRAELPDVTLSTDVIVGFPGETDEDFEATVALVERLNTAGLFGFKYSERPFTPALKLGDDVPEATKAARLERLFEVSERLRRAQLASLVGSVQRVLVEGPGKEGGYTGRTERNEIVHVGASDDPTGEIVELTIVEAFKNSLMGELVEERRRSPRVVRERPGAATRSDERYHAVSDVAADGGHAHSHDHAHAHDHHEPPAARGRALPVVH